VIYEGIILLSTNEDYKQPKKWNKYLVLRSFPECYNKQDGSTAVLDNIWTLENGLKVLIPQKMYRYNAMPDVAGYEEATFAIRRRFFFEAWGINERNVAILATNSLTINNKANDFDPLLTSGGIAEPVICTLLLPQVESANGA
jgi:dipeptidase